MNDVIANKQALDRNFSTQQLNSWIKSDQLTNQQQKSIYKLIKKNLDSIQVLSPKQFWQSLPH